MLHRTHGPGPVPLALVTSWLILSVGPAQGDEPKGALAADARQEGPSDQEPNGVMETCTIWKDDVPMGGQRWTAMVGRAGSEAFLIALPAADDWKLQCDRAHPFWAVSWARRLHLTVNAYHPQPDEDLSPKAYLGWIGRNVKEGSESMGLRVERPTFLSLGTRDNEELLAIGMTVDAPENRPLALFPQDTFFTARRLPDGTMLDLHVTTYYDAPKEQETQRSLAVVVMGAFTIHNQATDQRDSPSAKAPPRGLALPSLPGVATSGFSSDTINAVKAQLDCKKERIALYCDGLDRFSKAKAMSLAGRGVWGGSAYTLAAVGEGKPAQAAEGLHYLYLKEGRAFFNVIQPSNEAEWKEARAILLGVHAQRAPAPDTFLMSHLRTFTPSQTFPVETRNNCLAYSVTMGAPDSIKQELSQTSSSDLPRVCMREDARARFALEIWGKGTVVKIGLFPKD